MTHLAKNLKWLRKQSNLTQTELAEVLDLNRPIIGSYEEGRAQPKAEVLILLSKYFGVSVEKLVGTDLTKKSSSKPNNHSSTKILTIAIGETSGREKITLVPVKAAAGYLNGYGDPEFVGTLPTFDLPINELKGGRTYRMFQIKGDSMLPVPDGSYIICSYVEQAQMIKPGKCYVLLTLNDGIVFKRAKNTPAGNKSLVLQSDNKAFRNFSIKPSEIIEIWQAHGFMSFEL